MIYMIFVCLSAFCSDTEVEAQGVQRLQHSFKEDPAVKVQGQSNLEDQEPDIPQWIKDLKDEEPNFPKSIKPVMCPKPGSLEAQRMAERYGCKSEPNILWLQAMAAREFREMVERWKPVWNRRQEEPKTVQKENPDVDVQKEKQPEGFASFMSGLWYSTSR